MENFTFDLPVACLRKVLYVGHRAGTLRDMARNTTIKPGLLTDDERRTLEQSLT
jgi:hypothetical protein